MKFTPKSVLSAASLMIGGFIGASALVAFAASGTWTSAPPNPPQNNVPAPINIGLNPAVMNIAGVQEKTDSMIIDGGLNILGNLVVSTGTPAAGDVLTAVDNVGTVGWKSGGSGVYNASLSTNGYEVFPNGLILEWGHIVTKSTYNNNPATSSFPMAFPNQAFSITVTAGEKGNGSGDKQSQWGGKIINNSTFQYYAQYENADTGPFDLYWMATGW